MKKLIFPVLILAIALGVFALDKYMDRRAEQEVKRVFKELGVEGEYEEVDYLLLKNQILVKNFRIRDKEGEFFASELLIKKFSEDGVDIEYKGIKVSEDDKLSEDFRSLGYKDFSLDGGVKVDIDKEKGAVEVSKAFAELKDGFRIEMSLRLEGIDIDFWKDLDPQSEINPFLLMAQLSEIKLIYAKFLFADLGIKRRLLEAGARKEGMSYREFKRKLIKELNRDILKAKSAEEARLLMNFKKFLEEGKEIKIEIKPQRGLSLGKALTTLMFTPQDKVFKRALALFNVKAEVN